MPSGDDWDADLDDQDPSLETDEEDTEQDADGDEDADAGDTGESGQAGDAKRLRDLQSRADKAEARANKLQKQLEAQGKSSKNDGKEAGVVPPELQQWLTAAQDSARTRFYESDPRFKAYGVDPALISGATPEEMKGSADRLKKQIDRLETAIRKAILTEHGYVEEPRGGSNKMPKADWAGMSSEAFNKQLKELGY